MRTWTTTRALAVLVEGTNALVGWYPDRGVQDVVLVRADGQRALLLTKRGDGRAWLTNDLARALLSKLLDFVPREECYAMPERAPGQAP